MKKEFDKEVLKEMILYISERCHDTPTFGSTLLNKILHYSDFLWYGYTGEPMSGEIYIRREHGQTPKHLLEVREELELEGKLKIDKRDYFGKQQKRPVLTTSPVYTKLTVKQRNFMNEIIKALSGYNATGVSEQIAHQDLSWQYLNDGEEIPYETVFFRRQNPISEETLTWARSVIGEYEKSHGGAGSVVQDN